jgi:uncharacterized RDD family membrane protein YckC
LNDCLDSGTLFVHEFQRSSEWKPPSRSIISRGQPHVMIPDSLIRNTRFGGFWIRFTALLIDAAIIEVVRLPVALVFWALSDDFSFWGGPKSGRTGTGLGILYLVINLGIWFAYFVFMDVRYQATLGKTAMKLKVVGIDFQPITLKKAILRETIGKAISLVVFLIGFIWAAFDPRKQAWHDKIAETYVTK